MSRCDTPNFHFADQRPMQRSIEFLLATNTGPPTRYDVFWVAYVVLSRCARAVSVKQS